MDLLQARYANAVIMPRILNKSEKVKTSGSQVSIQIRQKLTVGNVAAGGGYTPQAPAPTQANVVVNTWKHVSIEIDDMAKAQSFWDPNSDFPKDAGKALGVQEDTDIALQFPNLNGLGVVGDFNNPTAFDDVAARSSVLRLANANVPIEDMSFILPPIAIYMGWMAKTELTAAYSTGLPKNLNTAGYKPTATIPLVGVPSYMTTVLPVSANALVGALLHREALAIAMQLEHDYALVDRKPALVLSHAGVTQDLYGIAVIRADHAVRIAIAQN